MQTESDAQLLRDYARSGSEAAFRELVARYANLVYSAARRQIEDTETAQDIAQSVFIDLARKARGSSAAWSEEAGLAPWLYLSTRYAALRRLRDDRRRKKREWEAMELFDTGSDPQAAWDRVRPVLDEAMAELGEQDRRALLLRFFNNKDLRSVGLAMGVSENAAQKRLARALEKLRASLARRGATTSAATLATALTGNAIQIAPAGFAASAASAGLAAASSTTGLTTLFYKIMTLSKIQTGAVCLALLAAPLAWQWCAQAQLGKQTAAARGLLESAKSDLGELDRAFADNQAAYLRAQNGTIEAQRRLDELKSRSKSTPQVAYHWRDDRQVVRVPKSLLQQINFKAADAKNGDLTPAAVELLQLTGEEAGQTSAALKQFLAVMRQAETARLTQVAPTASELRGRPSDQVRVFAVGDVTPEFQEARNQLFSSLQEIMEDDRLNLFKQGLQGLINATDPRELDPGMAIYPDAKRVIVRQPGFEAAQPSFDWSVSILAVPGANGLNWGMGVNDVPEPYQSQLTDWIAQAKARTAAQRTLP
jgi:RNA polymerase sigma factor (sigma-70 family)